MAASYSEHDKAVAIEIVERFGGQVSQECLETIRHALAAPKLNKATVWRWWTARPVATGLQPEKTAIDPALVDQALDDMFETTARKMLIRAAEDEVIGKMRGQELVTSAAIATDKMRLLRNLPTEIVQVLPDLLEALRKLGLNPVDMFNAIIAEAAVQDDQR